MISSKRPGRPTDVTHGSAMMFLVALVMIGFGMLDLMSMAPDHGSYLVSLIQFLWSSVNGRQLAH